MPMDNARMPQDARHLLWRRTRRLTALLLAMWLLATLVSPWFARSLNARHIAGLPLGYWLAAQGLLVFFLLIIVVYVIWMDRLEARFRSASPASEGSKASDEPR
jgi:putative solute:sodium symporter small subunit